MGRAPKNGNAQRPTQQTRLSDAREPVSATAAVSILAAVPVRKDAPAPVVPPEYFADLRLDRVFDSILASRDHYGLEPFFYGRLTDEEAIRYRHEVFRDLEHEPVYRCFAAFAERMLEVHRCRLLSETLDFAEQREGWLLQAVLAYAEAVAGLARDLERLKPASRALRAVARYLSGYVSSAAFTTLTQRADELARTLSEVVYCVHIRGRRVTVTRYDEEPDYSEQVLRTFERFKQREASDHSFHLPLRGGMTRVEGAIVARVAKLFPEVFGALASFSEHHRDFMDPTVAQLEREVQFYLGWIEYVRPLKEAGLRFCYPEIGRASKESYATDTFDLALAAHLVAEGREVVLNDFELRGPEHIIVVSGPNQGGKTTFARMFGQLHHLAALGCPVPGTQARIFLTDGIYTHFEREESLTNAVGKLEDDLLRMQAILGSATSESVIVVNEAFTSTTLQDALFLGTRLMDELIELGALCVYVTFLDELARRGPQVVSMVSTVLPEAPEVRTYRIVRRPADGLAYAMALARKHGLTYELLRERVCT